MTIRNKRQSRRIKNKGREWENKVVAFLRGIGFKGAERRRLTGVEDRGDIGGCSGWCIEAKSEISVRLAQYVKEINAETADNEHGFVWMKRRGSTDPADGYCVTDGAMMGAIMSYVRDLEEEVDRLRKRGKKATR